MVFFILRPAIIGSLVGIIEWPDITTYSSFSRRESMDFSVIVTFMQPTKEIAISAMSRADIIAITVFFIGL